MTKSIHVNASGKLTFDGKVYQSAIGKTGVTNEKQEGDMKTPLGCYPVRKVWYRKDRVEAPETEIPVFALQENDGWSDDVSSMNYNQRIKLPAQESHEALFRDDHLYDIIVVLGFNDKPVIQGAGSAIFMHIAREEMTPTAGCIALSEPDLREILENMEKDTQVCISE